MNFNKTDGFNNTDVTLTGLIINPKYPIYYESKPNYENIEVTILNILKTASLNNYTNASIYCPIIIQSDD